MSTQYRLDGDGFVSLIRAGHQRLKQNVNEVNALNIFPVPDGDTGTNMELSLASGVARLSKAETWTLAAAVQALTTGLLMGARGNSGVILSQLFRGFTKASQKENHLDVKGFAFALNEGVQIAYQAVAKPVEGTILTVAREAAAAGLKASSRTTGDLLEWFEVVVRASERALASTPEQLPVLKQAGVVDSGGQGLVHIYQGMLAYLRGDLGLSEDSIQVTPSLTREALSQSDFAAAHVAREGEHGYCTEVLVRLSPDKAELEGAESKLRRRFAEYGDSLLVVRADDLIKVHVHTIHPGQVLEDALQYGSLAQVKVENMTQQHDEILVHAQTEDTSNAFSKLGMTKASTPKEKRDIAVVAVAAGEGLREVFHSLGADVLDGGQTMNPSTEQIVAAVHAANAHHVMILPNNKNVILAAEQAKEVLGDAVTVLSSVTIPQGISAMTAFLPKLTAAQNQTRMQEAMRQVISGQVVQAVRDSVYQERQIRDGQYLGLVEQDLVEVGDARFEVAKSVIRQMGTENKEVLTVFTGQEIAQDEAQALKRDIEQEFSVEVEVHPGNQPIYHYIFALE